MPLCVKCNRDVCNPCIRDVSRQDNRPKIYVATDDELSRISYFRRLAIASAALKSELALSRRSIPDWLADAIFSYEGRILWPHEGPFIVRDTAIDDAFNNDGSFRWISGFLNFAEVPPRQAPQYRVMTRLRLIDLAFRIARPDTARHFGR